MMMSKGTRIARKPDVEAQKAEMGRGRIEEE